MVVRCVSLTYMETPWTQTGLLNPCSLMLSTEAEAPQQHEPAHPAAIDAAIQPQAHGSQPPAQPAADQRREVVAGGPNLEGLIRIVEERGEPAFLLMGVPQYKPLPGESCQEYKCCIFLKNEIPAPIRA